jgi:capsid protein
MNFLDRAVAFVNPRWGVERAVERERLKMFGYDAARPGNYRGRSGGLHKNASSESARTNRDRITLMWDTRDVVRNFGILRGMVARIVQYVADRVQYVSQTGDEEIDTVYQDYFHAWCEDCDLTGRHRLRDLVWMLVWALIVDGDHGWNFVESNQRGETKLRLQAVEADRIGNPNEPVNANNPDYVGGITIDPATGAPLSYRIFNRNRISNQYTLDAEVPADQFIHVFDPMRVDQYRGVTPLAPAIAPARDLYEAITFEIQAAKWQIGHSGFIKTADPTRADGGVSAWNGATTTGNGTTAGLIEMQAAKVLRLSQGEDVVFAPGTSRPNGAFQALIETLVRQMSTTLNMPYGFMYDMTQFSGHTGRIEIAQAMRGIRRWQYLVGEQALDRVRDQVLARGIGLREIPAHPKWRSGRWGFGPSLTGDYGHDTQANLQLLEAGLVTATDLIAESGQTFEEVSRRSASEVAYLQRVAMETNIPIELITKRLLNPTAALAAINTPPSPPPPMVEAGTDVKPLLEILSNAGEGIMDRESAIMAIVNMYGLPRAQVEKMVPKPAPQAKAESGNGKAESNKSGKSGKSGNSKAKK